MNVELIKPFISETLHIFEKMIGVTLVETALEKKSGAQNTFDVSVFIGVTGTASGGVVLSWPEDVACRVVSRMIRRPVEAFDNDVTDGLGELVNIIAGNACRVLSEKGTIPIDFSLPTIVVGRHRPVWRSRDLPCLMMRFFDSEIGPMSLEVALRPPG